MVALRSCNNDQSLGPIQKVVNRNSLLDWHEPDTFRSENEYLSHHPQNDHHCVVAITDLFRYRYTTLPPVSLWIGTNVGRLEPCTFRSESEYLSHHAKTIVIKWWLLLVYLVTATDSTL
ncbi:hypothetical protein TNCV_721061 [Trichonephila clavipes]|nr:hypothetical protein TNCV_721061 [Trichonephila clavipes]